MVEQINYVLVEKKRPMMYKAMKYWGKKPASIFRTYIEHYSEPNEIVLDAFAGSGVCPLESIQAGRKAIAIDLNPVATFMTRELATPLNMIDFKRTWEELKNNILKFEKDSGLFTTKCPECNAKARIINVHYDKVPINIRYKCPNNKKNKEKPLDKEDLDIIAKSESMEIPYWYPKDKFPNAEAFNGAKRSVGDYFYGLWTKRNLYALAYMYGKICSIENKDIRDAFKLGFIHIVHLSTKMVSAREDPNTNRPDSGSWGRPAYLFPAKHLEQNPFVLFDRAIEDRQGMISAKESSNRLIDGKAKFAKNFDELKNKDKNLLILTENTVQLSSLIPEESVDYVLTDPPYGGLVKYFDLSSIWSIWLKGKEQDTAFDMRYDEEIILDNDGDFDNYDRMLFTAFREINKVLKQGKYLTVTFHNKQPKIFNLIIKSCINAGFNLDKILYQQNRRASESGVANPWGTAISDFYLRFRKPTKEEKHEEGLNRGNFEKMVVKSAIEVILKRGQPTEMTHIINGVYMELFKYGQLIDTNQDDIANVLKRRIGEEFVIVESDEEGGKIKARRWWLTDKELNLHKPQTPLEDRVEDTIKQMFSQKIMVSYDDILQKLFTTYNNAMTPDYNNMIELLKLYGTKSKKAGMWVIKETEKTNEGKHTVMEKVLAKIGKEFGYNVWSADRNKDEELKSICEDNLPFEFEGKARVEEIDVLWFKEDKIYYAFEIENTTTITSALERCSNLPNKDTKKRILIPIEKAKLLNRKIKEPMFKRTFEEDRWEVSLYEDLETYSRKRSQTEEEFNQIFATSLKTEQPSKQSTIS